MGRIPFKIQMVIIVVVAILLFWGGAKYQEIRLQSMHHQATMIGEQTGSGSKVMGQELPVPGVPEEEMTDRGKAGELVVHVVGAVEKPGIYRFMEGERVNEAVEQAIPLSEADLSQLNLALPLVDGKQINVPFLMVASKTGNTSKPVVSSTGPTQVAPTQSNESDFARSTPADQIGQNNNSGTTVSGGTEVGKIRVNTATKSELESLPGIGPALAERIITYREKNGRFSKPEDLLKVSGIGELTLAKFKEKITVE